MSKREKASVLAPEPGLNVVTLGNRQYEVRPLAIGPLKRAKKLFQDTAAELLNRLVALQGEQIEAGNVGSIVGQMGDVLDLMFDRVPELLCAFIPGLDPAIFDADDGPTVPQIIEAAQVIVRVNGLDRLPNLLRQATALR